MLLFNTFSHYPFFQVSPRSMHPEHQVRFASCHHASPSRPAGAAERRRCPAGQTIGRYAMLASPLAALLHHQSGLRGRAFGFTRPGKPLPPPPAQSRGLRQPRGDALAGHGAALHRPPGTAVRPGQPGLAARGFGTRPGEAQLRVTTARKRRAKSHSLIFIGRRNVSGDVLHFQPQQDTTVSAKEPRAVFQLVRVVARES